jgi:hypothetical protein
MFKYFSLLVLFASFGLNMKANAQETAVTHDRLSVKFSETELAKMTTDERAFWDYFVTDGFVIFDITKDASESEMLYLDFEGTTNQFNPLALGLMPEETAINAYRLGNTGQGVMILSKAKIKVKMDRTR